MRVVVAAAATGVLLLISFTFPAYCPLEVPLRPAAAVAGSAKRLPLAGGSSHRLTIFSHAGPAPEWRCAGMFLQRGGQGAEKAGILPGTRELCASREGWSDVPRLGQGAGHTRITQPFRVGALRPKLHSLGGGRLVGRSARFDRKCTTCKPRGPDDASQHPRAPGDHPACTSRPREARQGRGKMDGK